MSKQGIQWVKGTPSQFEHAWKVGVLNMLAEIDAKAKNYAPVKTSNLVNSGEIQGNSVIFGNKQAPYARLRHFVNNLHPGTRYDLSRAAEEVAKSDLRRFFS